MSIAATKRAAMVHGSMSEAEHALIERLAVEMNDPTPSKIARRLNRHPSTVKWYMIRRGLWESETRYAAKPYRRKGQLIHPFSPEQDARIELLRAEGKKAREIANIVSAEFGVPRNHHSVAVRLVLLASYNDREDGATPTQHHQEQRL